MRFTRVSALALITAAGAVALAGCAAPGTEEPEIVENSIVTAAQNQAFTSANNGTADQNTTYNGNITYMTSAGFNYYDNTPTLVQNTDFGTYELVSEDPLTVTYTVNEGVTWSDGTQVDAADMMLSWVQCQSEYNDPKGDVNFGSVSAGATCDLMEMPEIGEDGRTVTITYSEPYVDWELNFGVGMPAHIVYQLAFPDVEDPEEAKAGMISAIQDGDTEALAEIAAHWTKDFEMTSMPDDERLLVSNGAYTITDLTDSYVTLTAREDYVAGPTPQVQTITVRFITDPTAQVQALENGEIDIFYGQPTEDTVNTLAEMEGVTYEALAGAVYEHIDLTFNNGGPFDPATYDGDEETARLVREAFLKIIPREEIVTNLIQPISPDAAPMNSQLFFPGADGYEESAAANGSAEYTAADPEAAAALLEEAGVETPIDVDFMYAADNPRRASEYELVAAAGEEAGFNVINDVDVNWGARLGDGSYDASLFAWVSTSTAVTSSQATFQTGQGNNLNGYSNEAADELWTELQSTFDPETQIELLTQIDAMTFEDAYGLPLYQYPDLVAYSDAVENVSGAPLSPNVFWNFWEWTPTEAAVTETTQG